MSPSIRPALVTALTALGLLLAPVNGLSESVVVTGSESRGASATLNFRIVIPPVMRVLKNSHPLQIDPEADGSLSAQQRLVVMSNMKRGFCVTLRLADPALDDWQLTTAPQSGVQLSLRASSRSRHGGCARRLRRCDPAGRASPRQNSPPRPASATPRNGPAPGAPPRPAAARAPGCIPSIPPHRCALQASPSCPACP